MIFEEVIGLPPKRSHDHQISLVPGTEPCQFKTIQTSLGAEEYHRKNGG